MANQIIARGTLAFAGLTALYKIGGAATAAAWSAALGRDATAEKFEANVASALVAAGYVRRDVGFVLTEQGFEALGRKARGKYSAPAAIVPPRSQAEFKPLQRSRSAMVYRAGAFDYRAHPSLVGGERIAYRANGIS
jgi:hypothetical protein